MKIKSIILALPLLAACSAVEPAVDMDAAGTAAVIVSGYEGDTKAAVSAESYTETVPSETNKLYADIWFSTVAGTYPGTTYGTAGVSTDGLSVDAHRKITYMSPSITNPDLETGQTAIKYPSGKTLYCVGFYPQTAWSVISGGTQATATVDGVRDLMFAPQISGTQSVPLSATVQQFSHQQCWLKVRVRSQDLTAGETWGKIQKIEVKTKPTATADLAAGTVAFSGTEVYLTAFENLSGTDMPIMSTEFASLFAAPVTTSKYTVKVTCEHHTREVDVSLTDNEGHAYVGSTAGKVFVLTLYFTPLATIEFTATLSNWEDEARSITLS